MSKMHASAWIVFSGFLAGFSENFPGVKMYVRSCTSTYLREDHVFLFTGSEGCYLKAV